MADEFIPKTCERCKCAFSVGNSWVELDRPCAICPHCGQRTMVDPQADSKGRKRREESSAVGRAAVGTNNAAGHRALTS